MYGTQFLFKVDDGIQGPGVRTQRNGPPQILNIPQESLIKRAQQRKKEIDTYLTQLTSKETETIMASIEGAAMRMPSPNRDDELDDA